MASKCGNCLMETVQVVALRPDGSCPRCEGNYSTDTPPRNHEIRRYVLRFSARLAGGIRHCTYTATREGVTVEGAWEQLSDGTYGEITRLGAKPAKGVPRG